MPTAKATKRGAVSSSTEKTVKHSRVVRPKTPAAVSLEIDKDRVAKRAYFLWLERGSPEGSAQEDWLHAEQELLAK